MLLAGGRGRAGTGCLGPVTRWGCPEASGACWVLSVFRDGEMALPEGLWAGGKLASPRSTLLSHHRPGLR